MNLNKDVYRVVDEEENKSDSSNSNSNNTSRSVKSAKKMATSANYYAGEKVIPGEKKTWLAYCCGCFFRKSIARANIESPSELSIKGLSVQASNIAKNKPGASGKSFSII